MPRGEGLREEVRHALTYDPEHEEQLARQYVRHACADTISGALDGVRVADRSGRRRAWCPDSRFLTAVEEYMDGDAVERTRAQVAAYVGMGGHEGADAGDLATYLLVEEPQFQRSIRDVLYTEEIQSGGRFIDTGHHLRPDLVTAEDGDVRIRPDVYAAWCDSMMKMGYSAEEAEVLVDGFGVEVAKERIVSEVERHGYPADEAEQLVAQGAVKVRGDPPVLLVDETARDAEADSTQQSFWDQLMAE